MKNIKNNVIVENNVNFVEMHCNASLQNDKSLQNYKDVLQNISTKKNTKKYAFTIVELIMVVLMIGILSTISFLSYSSTMYQVRNSARVADMSNIQISLKNHKLKNNFLPIPGNSFEITNMGTGIINQGFFNDEISMQDFLKKPKDPLLKTKFYTYSIMKNRLFFQIALTLETKDNLESMIDGDYQQVAEFVPSLVFSSYTGGEVNTLSGKFIIDKAKYNLPYDKNGNLYSANKSFNEVITETGTTISKFAGFYSCQEIYENSYSMGSGMYMITTSTGAKTSTGCNM